MENEMCHQILVRYHDYHEHETNIDPRNLDIRTIQLEKSRSRKKHALAKYVTDLFCVHRKC